MLLVNVIPETWPQIGYPLAADLTLVPRWAAVVGDSADVLRGVVAEAEGDKRSFPCLFNFP